MKKTTKVMELTPGMVVARCVTDINGKVVLSEGAVLDRKEVRKYLLERLAAYKVPREFFFCTQLPKNSTGKILKTALREQALIDMVNRKR